MYDLLFEMHEQIDFLKKYTYLVMIIHKDNFKRK